MDVIFFQNSCMIISCNLNAGNGTLKIYEFFLIEFDIPLSFVNTLFTL